MYGVVGVDGVYGTRLIAGLIRLSAEVHWRKMEMIRG